MIRIGFDASRAFTKDRTGTENYSYQLLKALAKIDKKNKYILHINPYLINPKSKIRNLKQYLNTNDKNNKRLEHLIFENLNLFRASKLEFRNFVVKAIRWPRFWTQGGLAWSTFRDDLDVLFVPAHTLPLIRKPGLKTVVTVHDLGAEYLPQMHQLKQRLYLNFMTRYQLKSASHIIAVSGATKHDLVKKVGIDPKKITVIYEGYDREKFRVQSSEFRVDLLVNRLRYYGLVPRKYFLFVGTVQPRKNLERLIKAFAKSLENFGRQSYSLARQRKRPAVSRLGYALRLSADRLGLAAFGGSLPSLIIVGQKGWLSDEIDKLPKKLRIEDRVKFLGYVPDKDMSALYSGAIALVFPSLFEGFGLPILEAQACGCPVITSNVSSMPEVAGKGAIFVNPYDVDDIVKGMIRIKQQELRIKLIKAGFDNIKRFSWEKCAEETLEVLEKLKS